MYSLILTDCKQCWLCSQSQLNTPTMALKATLVKTLCSDRDTAWHIKRFFVQGDELSFGAGKSSLSAGRFMLGHKVSLIMKHSGQPKHKYQHLANSINPSASLWSSAVQKWLVDIQLVEQLLDVVLHIIHLELWTANSTAIQKLIQELPGILWPTIYSGMDIIIHQITPPHVDAGGVLRSLSST